MLSLEGYSIMPSTTQLFDQQAALVLLDHALDYAQNSYGWATLRAEAELQLEVQQARDIAGLLLAVGFAYFGPGVTRGVGLLMNKVTEYNIPNTLYEAAIRVDGQASQIVNTAAEWAKSSGPGLLASANSMSTFFSGLRRNFASRTTHLLYANVRQPTEVLLNLAYRYHPDVVHLEENYLDQLRVVALAYREMVMSIQDTTWNVFEGDVNLGRFMRSGSPVWGIFSRTHNNLAVDSLSLYEMTAFVSDPYMFRLALARSYQEHGGPWSMNELQSNGYNRHMNEDAILRAQYPDPARAAGR